MSLKNSADSISLTEEISFIQDFLALWQKVKDCMHSDKEKYDSWRTWSKLAKKLLVETTLPFYNKWKNLSYIDLVEEFYTNFFSFVFNINGLSVIIPYQLIFYEAIKDVENAYTNLQSNKSLEQLRRSLYIISGDLNLKLRKNDIKLLRKLASPHFSKSLDRFPKLRELAYGVRQDVRTIKSRLEYFFKCYILSTYYFVDMSRIGYQTVTFSHSTERKNIPKQIQEFIMLNFPNQHSEGYLSVVQFPYTNMQLLSQLFKVFNCQSKDLCTLSKQYRGWNLGGLTTDPQDRWKLRPPLLSSGGSWNFDVILGKTGINYNLNPSFDIYDLSRSEADLLGFIHLYEEMNIPSLEKQLEKSRKVILTDWKKLLRHQIIHRCPRFFQMGLGSWIFFQISNLDFKWLRQVIQHFKFFPFSNIYYNDSEEGVTMIGYVNIPLEWTHVLLYRFASLKHEFPEAKASYYIGPDIIARWSMNIMKTFDWKRFE